MLIALDEWKAVPGYEGLYEVSRTGAVRSLGSSSDWSRWRGYAGAILNGTVSKAGYRQVCLRKEGKEKSILVHVLVAKAFHGEKVSPELMVCHGDGRRLNNRASNLRWGTALDNHVDSAKHGTRLRRHMHPRTKLTEGDIVGLRSFEGTVSAAAREFGCSREFVRSIWCECGRRTRAAGGV